MYCKYNLFGLNLLSFIELPELIRADHEKADVIISTGTLPGSLTKADVHGPYFQANPREFLLEVPGVARYYIQNGKKIRIEPAGDPDIPSVRLFLLGSAFSIILFQRGLFHLHGSSVLIDRVACCIAGPSGSGKSVTTLGLIRQGAKLFSDDKTVITIREGQPYVLPGFPVIKIWKDMLETFNIRPEKELKLRNGLNKYRSPMAEHHISGSHPLKSIYILHQTNRPGTDIEELRGPELFHALREQTGRIQYINRAGLLNDHFDWMRGITGSTPVYRVHVPKFTGHYLPVHEVIIRHLTKKTVSENESE